MIATAWNNGEHKASGAGYGLKLTPADRDAHFSARWESISLELPNQGRSIEAEVNVAKKSFWDSRCRELIDQEIGGWLIANRLAPWPWRKPPRIEIKPLGGRRFRILGVAAR